MVLVFFDRPKNRFQIIKVHQLKLHIGNANNKNHTIYETNTQDINLFDTLKQLIVVSFILLQIHIFFHHVTFYRRDQSYQQ